MSRGQVITLFYIGAGLGMLSGVLFFPGSINGVSLSMKLTMPFVALILLFSYVRRKGAFDERDNLIARKALGFSFTALWIIQFAVVGIVAVYFTNNDSNVTIKIRHLPLYFIGPGMGIFFFLFGIISLILYRTETGHERT